LTDIYDSAKKVASLLISLREGDLTPEIIGTCVAEACKVAPASQLDAAGRAKLTRDLEANFQAVIGVERELVGEDEGWDPWLLSRKGSIRFDYWKRYDDWLKAQGDMNSDVMMRLDQSTDTILGYLGDPDRHGAWDRRGLVVGLVQAGKTSNYIGLINKAIDTGYKVIVILTGFTDSLRTQTQLRAEKGILGYSEKPGKQRGVAQYEPVGVGHVDPTLTPIDSVTTQDNDFKNTAAKTFRVAPDGKQILFVIKKNVYVLNNLLAWISNFGNATDNLGNKFIKGIPLLVIDDESDVGSVDTKKGAIDDNDDEDPDHEPTKINDRIRTLLKLFDQSSYVGYTATPFANCLIHDKGRTELLGDDLFPRSFIVSLPTPSNHVGPSMIFGIGGDDSADKGLPLIRPIPASVQDSDGWMPIRHNQDHHPKSKDCEEVPPSLREAILSFILVVAARRLRGDTTSHNSMLVHVTRLNRIQTIVTDQIVKELYGISERLRSGTADKELIHQMRELWDHDFSTTTSKIAKRQEPLFQNPTHTWEAISNNLIDAATSIEVLTINGYAREALDYEKHKKKGRNVICVGGNKLSRGLTLEGLSVSYFLRPSKMYDTLMQMGRWFGYRPGYLDLCRLYTTRSISRWFSHIASATEELRGEFDLMANSGSSPKEFGLRIRSHPEIAVTSAAKMRYGEKLLVSFDGVFTQTINFHSDAATVIANRNVGDKLIRRIMSDSKAVKGAPPKKGSTMWNHVDPQAVADFIGLYKEFPVATKVKTHYMAEYIRKELEQGRLSDWTVLLKGIQAGGKTVTLGDISTNAIHRGWDLDGPTKQEQEKHRLALKREHRFRISVLGDPKDQLAGVAKDSKIWLDALAEEQELFRNKKNPKVRFPDEPSGTVLRKHRNDSQGLLILYLIVPPDDGVESPSEPILGFGLSFPYVKNGRSSKVEYIVSSVEQRNEE